MLSEPTKSVVKVNRSKSWLASLIVGLIAGVCGGGINLVLLRTSLTSVDDTAVLVICGIIPAVVAALAVTRVSKIAVQVIVALFLGGLAVEIVFLLGWLMAGGDRATFIRHLPFWLGPGDDQIIMGESIMLGFGLGSLSGLLAGIVQGLKAKVFRG